MSTNAQNKEADKVARFLEQMALEADTHTYVKIEGDNHRLAVMLRGLARRIRDGEHRR